MKSIKKNKKKLFTKNKVPNVERRYFTRRASDRAKNRNHLKDLVRQQADELKVKDGQIKNGAQKQIWQDEQIQIHTKALESTVDGIFIIDAQKPDLPVIYANQSFQKMTGYTKREIIGRNYFLFYGVSADRRMVDEIKQTIIKKKSFHGEMLSFRKNGKKYWNLLRIAPVRDATGAVTHYVGIQTDITLLREKELEIDEQRDELLHVTRLGKLAEFVSSLAHEINQPLTAILSYAQAAQRMFAGKEPELQKILSYIVSDNQRAAAVIQRMRALLKRSKPELKPIDINTLVEETVKLIETDLTVRNIVLRLEPESDLPIIKGDRIQLQQVLLNLLSNSFDAIENSPEPHEISIRTSLEDNGKIIVAVKDSGCGVPPENIPKLFEHFFTSKPDGLGMGLSISRSIVEAHGGRLDAQSNPDRGATFYFTLPVITKDA